MDTGGEIIMVQSYKQGGPRGVGRLAFGTSPGSTEPIVAEELSPHDDILHILSAVMRKSHASYHIGDQSIYHQILQLYGLFQSRVGVRELPPLGASNSKADRRFRENEQSGRFVDRVVDRFAELDPQWVGAESQNNLYDIQNLVLTK